MTRMTVSKVKAALRNGASVEGLESGELGAANDRAPEWLPAWERGLVALDIAYANWPGRRFYFNFRHFGKGVEWEREHVFTGAAGWQFDWANIATNVAVEIDGIARNVRGGGRHTTAADGVKITTARGLGWAVFQFVPELLRISPQLCAASVCAELMRRDNWGSVTDLSVRLFLEEYISGEAADAWRAAGGK